MTQARGSGVRWRNWKASAYCRRQDHQAADRQKGELERQVGNRGRVRGQQYQGGDRQAVEHIRSTPQGHRDENRGGHDRRSNRRGLISGERHIGPDEGHGKGCRQPAGVDPARRFPESRDQGTKKVEGDDRQGGHVQPAHAQDVGEPAEGELILQLVPKLCPQAGRHGEVQRGGLRAWRDPVCAFGEPLPGVFKPTSPGQRT